MTQPTHQDDLARLLQILGEAPECGLSIEEIHKVTSATGETWSFRTINDLLCDLGRGVEHAKVRVGARKTTKYKIKGTL